MIIEVAILGVSSIITSCVLGPLWFVRASQKREDKLIEKYLQEVEELEHQNKPIATNEQLLTPFVQVESDVPCTFCGFRKYGNDGMQYPIICPNYSKCMVKIPHLHVQCSRCNHKWMMRTKTNR